MLWVILSLDWREAKEQGSIFVKIISQKGGWVPAC